MQVCRRWIWWRSRLHRCLGACADIFSCPSGSGHVTDPVCYGPDRCLGIPRKLAPAKYARILGVGCLVGTVIGMLTFKWMDEQAIRLIVGVIAVAFFVDFFRGGGRRPSRELFLDPVGYTLGTLSGFTSFVIHAGLPPVAMYLLPQRLDKRVHVGTIVVLFFLINYAKIIPYWWLGLLTIQNLSISLVLLPLAPIGMFIGIKFNHFISQKWFMRASYTILLLLGIRLLYEGLVPII